MSIDRWPTVRLRHLFSFKDLRGALAPLASATKRGVELRESMDASVWNPVGDTLGYKLVAPDDFVVGLRSFQHGIAHSNVTGLVSPAYTVLTPTEKVDAGFFKHYFRSTQLISQLANRTQGIRQGQSIDIDALSDLPIPLPSLSEQRRIAEYLDCELSRIDSANVAVSGALATLRERRSSNVFETVTGARFSGKKHSPLAWVKQLPSAWSVAKLSWIARMGSGHTPSRSRPEWWVDCTIPWITTGEVAQVRSDRVEVLHETREKISQAGLENSAAELHPAGTVVLCRTASAGYSAVMGVDMATSQDFATWTCGLQLDPYYLLWCLRAMRTDLLDRLAFGSTHRTIYMPDLQSLRIPLPGIEVQGELVRQIRQSNAATDRVIDCLARQSSLLDERRQALVSVAVSGQIDVTTARRVGT